jgi:hypothetical protein
MANLYSPKKNTLGEILSVSSPSLRVPDWQRSYSWTTKEAKEFWDDLISFSEKYPAENVDDQEYFLGSVVLVEDGDSYLVLDGQQRIATSVILLSALRDQLRNINSNNDAATSLANKYLVDRDYSTNATKYKITMNVYDRDFFRQEILADRNTDYKAALPRHESHRLIQKNRVYFEDKVRNYCDTPNAKDALNRVLRIQRVLTGHLSVIAITSKDEDNASAVFETLNDRGIGLSTTDLLRSFLLRRSNDADREEIVRAWEEIFDLDNIADVDGFIRHFWISHRGDVKSRSLYREIKNDILKNDASSKSFVADMQNAANYYEMIISPELSTKEVSGALGEIHLLNAKSLIPAALACLESSAGDLIKQEILNILINAYVRYIVIAKLDGSRFESMIYGLAPSLRKSPDPSQLRQALKDKLPTNAEFKSAFGKVVVSRRNLQRYLLLKLESALDADREIAPPKKVHVEHIYPQKPKVAWDGDHRRWIDRLGNLTLLARGLNQSAKNAEFADKLPKYRESELLLTKELTGLTAWNSEQIEKRQAGMAERAESIWAI